MRANAGICLSAGANSCLVRRLASVWESRCLWVRSTRGGKLERQRYARRTGCGANMMPALEGKHAGHGERIWCPSIDGNHADTTLSALTAVRSTARKRHDDDYSSPPAES